MRRFQFLFSTVKGSEDSEKKRKYDDIQTDPDSEDSLAGFDIDEYQSEEDSDYEVCASNTRKQRKSHRKLKTVNFLSCALSVHGKVLQQ